MLKLLANYPKHLTDHYIKKYPSGYKLITYQTPYLGSPTYQNNQKTGRSWELTEQERADYLSKSIDRTKTLISDIVLCNDFSLFVTLTVNCRACVPKCDNHPCTCDKKTCKRFDLNYVIRTQKGWLNNMIKKYGRFPYLQVMEQHKNGAFHFHALFKDYPGELKPQGTDPKDGERIYRLTNYRKGFSTAKKIYNRDGVARYVRQYITKNMPLFPGKKRFWGSQGLNRPMIVEDQELKAGKFAGYRNHNGKRVDKYYERYMCRSCKLSMTKADLHDQMTEKLKQAKTSQPVKDELKKAMQIVWERRNADGDQLGKRLEVKLSALKVEKDNLIRSIGSNPSLATDIAELVSKIKGEIAAVQDDLQKTSNPDTDFNAFVDFSLNYVDDLNAKWWGFDPR